MTDSGSGDLLSRRDVWLCQFDDRPQLERNESPDLETCFSHLPGCADRGERGPLLDAAGPNEQSPGALLDHAGGPGEAGNHRPVQGVAARPGPAPGRGATP